MLTFGSLFAGIGGFDLALARCGMRGAWAVEIDPDCRRVLAARFPDTLLLEDIRRAGKGGLAPVDLVCGGFPCQDLSVAGKRAGLQGGERSGLWWEMLRVIGELQPRFVLWENVPGLLSSDAGRDFRRVCSSLAEHDYFGCVRTLDARHFGVPQRRRRLFGLFVRGDPSAGRAAQILAVAESRAGHPAAGGEAGEDVASTLGSSPKGSGWRGDLDRSGAFVPVNVFGQESVPPLVARSSRGGNTPLAAGFHTDGQMVFQANGSGSFRAGAPTCSASDDNGSNQLVYQCHGNNVGPMGTLRAGNGNEAGGVPFFLDAYSCRGSLSPNQSPLKTDGVSDALDTTGPGAVASHSTQDPISGDVVPAMGHLPNAVAFHENQRGEITTNDTAGSLKVGGGKPGQGYPAIREGMVVRRLTPVECLRLQGFPDDWLDVDPPLSDSAMYRMCGNAVAVPCVEWIGRRIPEVT